MKKALSTALILGALYGTANAAPITSPLYLPSAGQITSTTKLGYTTASFDKSPEGVSDKLEDGVYLDLDGKIGINNSNCATKESQYKDFLKNGDLKLTLGWISR